ncbi:MAG: hypothetical protein HY674_07700, partial [Chloroflexi bacterium]|nr:hypothetical protein [Chloroflexota bacterium]
RLGTLWIVSESGLVTQFTNHEFRVRYAPPAPAEAVSGLSLSDEPRWFAFCPLAVDGNGVVWALQGTDTLLRFAGFGAPTIISLEGLPEGATQGVWSDRGGHVWLVKGFHACVFSDGRWQSFALEGGLSPLGSIASPGSEQGIWIANLGATHVRRRTVDGWDGSPIPLPVEPDAAGAGASAILEDSQGRLWVSAWWGGVHIHQTAGGWHSVQPRGPLAKCVVTGLFEDRQGAVWVGTIGEGLHQVLTQPVSTVLLPPDKPDTAVTALYAAQDGAIWMGTGAKGIYRWKPQSLAHFGVADGLPSESILSIREDVRTNLWVGTFAGLARLRESRFVPVAALNAPVQALFNDRSGDLWVGSQGGLWRLEGGTNWSALRSPSDRYLDIRCLTEDRAGRLWIAAFGSGLWRVEGDRMVPAEFQSRLHRTDVRSVLGDADGVLWIGTLYGGLYRWDGAQLQHYSRADGLPDDSIISITPDDDGHLWMSSNNGIFGCPRRSLAEYVRGRSPSLLCWHLGPTEGLANRGCSGGGQPVASHTAHGRLCIANMVGAAIFDPRVVTHGRKTPNLLVESVTADGVELAPGAAGFRAPASTRRFEFRYTAPDLAAARALRFRYRLEDLDGDWVEAGATRSASYSRLAPGEYRFRVMVGGSDGHWHESSRSLVLRIVPRLWELRWVQVLAGAALLSAIGGALAWNQHRKLQLRLQRLELQHVVEKERARVARDIHDDLGASLTEIVLMSDPEHAEFAEPDRVKPQLKRICGKARSLLQTLNQIVWVVNPRQDNLPKLLDYFCTFSEELCESARVRCWHEVPTGVPELALKVGFRHSLLLAVKEALNNVVKHAGATEVWLRVAVEPNRLKIGIEDNGRGFVVHETRASGNGLRNIRERLAELGGQAVISSTPGQGAQVTLIAPLNND